MGAQILHVPPLPPYARQPSRNRCVRACRLVCPEFVGLRDDGAALVGLCARPPVAAALVRVVELARRKPRALARRQPRCGARLPKAARAVELLARRKPRALRQPRRRARML